MNIIHSYFFVTDIVFAKHHAFNIVISVKRKGEAYDICSETIIALISGSCPTKSLVFFFLSFLLTTFLLKQIKYESDNQLGWCL